MYILIYWVFTLANEEAEVSHEQAGMNITRLHSFTKDCYIIPSISLIRDPRIKTLASI